MVSPMALERLQRRRGKLVRLFVGLSAACLSRHEAREIGFDVVITTVVWCAMLLFCELSIRNEQWGLACCFLPIYLEWDRLRAKAGQRRL